MQLRTAWNLKELKGELLKKRLSFISSASRDLDEPKVDWSPHRTSIVSVDQECTMAAASRQPLDLLVS